MKNNGRFIAEFEQHQGTIVMYPFRTDIWRDNAKYMQGYIINLVINIAQFEHVYLFCRKSDIDKLSSTLKDNITLVASEYDDIWARDIGPTFIEEDNEIKCINWKFNSWGGIEEGSYFPWDKDDSFAGQVADFFGLKIKNIDLVLEGGAILTDGEGTLFTTRSVLLNKNRNPYKSFLQVDMLLKEVLHLKKIVWLDQGLVMDETNGHVDNILTVVRPHELCLAWTDDVNNPNYNRVRSIYKAILKQYDCVIHKIPLPTLQYMTNEEAMGLSKNCNALDRSAGDLLPASYMNCYFVNGGIILPVFGCKEDELALQCFKEIFPNRLIKGIHSREPLLGGGGIHCILHEVPKLR